MEMSQLVCEFYVSGVLIKLFILDMPEILGNIYL